MHVQLTVELPDGTEAHFVSEVTPEVYGRMRFQAKLQSTRMAMMARGARRMWLSTVVDEPRATVVSGDEMLAYVASKARQEEGILPKP